MQVLAEFFSRLGTPVFMADLKGDLTGISQAGAASPKLWERLKNLGLDEPAWGASPVTLWDVFGEQGTPVRATITGMGPLLLALESQGAEKFFGESMLDVEQPHVRPV